VQSRLDAPLKVVHDRGRSSEVDNDLRRSQRFAIITDVKRSNELEIVSVVNSATDLSTHPSLGAENANLDAHAIDLSALPLSRARL
jgi:hypothetical protein